MVLNIQAVDEGGEQETILFAENVPIYFLHFNA